MNEFATMDAVSVMEVELIEGVPLWLVVLGVLAYILVILLIVLISWVIHASRAAGKKVHHTPSTHDVAVELQREILRSMQASSRQNTLMIWLTVLFITVSVVGGAVVTNFLQNIGDFGATWLGQLIELINPSVTQ
jgi:hypothetical protein